MIKGQIMDTTTHYKLLSERFQEKIERERKKYPLSHREEIFVDVISMLLDLLDGEAQK
mgnify:CR=1 FL=1